MNLLGDSKYEHGSQENIGILLVNLGTPEAPEPGSVRKYLRQFLSDPRVIEQPRWRWLPILYAFILPFRSPRTARAYRKIWREGSPLLQNCLAQRQRIAEATAGNPVKVELGMSYGKPSIRDALRSLRKQNCRRIVVLPLYPQYSSSTTGSVFCDIARELSVWRAVPHLRFISDYCDDPRYIRALAASVRVYQEKKGKPDKLVMSFHGTPLSMLTDGDPYFCLCQKTARLLATELGLQKEEWQITFQSRFGKEQWLLPYTDETLRELAARGAKHVQVICPGFSSDCLETLEEMDQENREVFLAGDAGRQFGYIPALNDSPAHMEFLVSLLQEAVPDWLTHLPLQNEDRSQQSAAAQSHMAQLPNK